MSIIISDKCWAPKCIICLPYYYILRIMNVILKKFTKMNIENNTNGNIKKCAIFKSAKPKSYVVRDSETSY
jgi:hypothetical protein